MPPAVTSTNIQPFSGLKSNQKEIVEPFFYRPANYQAVYTVLVFTRMRHSGCLNDRLYSIIAVCSTLHQYRNQSSPLQVQIHYFELSCIVIASLHPG